VLIVLTEVAVRRFMIVTETMVRQQWHNCSLED